MSKTMWAVLLMPLLALASTHADSQERQRSVTTPAKVVANDKAERHALVYKIVREWGPYVNQIHDEDIRAWADRMVPTFRQADIRKLRVAARADTFDSMINSLTGQKAPVMASMPGGVTPKSLGSTTNDLVFTPLASCNILDTRYGGGGAFTSGTFRHFKASGANFTAQGGSDTNCGIPSNPSALLLGVTAVTPTSVGWFKIWPYEAPQPVSSAISYGPSQNSRTDMIVRVSQGLTQDFTMLSNTAGVHVLISVLGYYSAPFATELECETITSAATTVLPSGFADATATCPGSIFTGFWANTGGGCTVGTSAIGRITRSEPTGTRAWNCRAYNEGVSNTSVTAKARCCRTPGRDPGIIFIP